MMSQDVRKFSLGGSGGCGCVGRRRPQVRYMATFEPVSTFSFDSMESRMRKVNRVPLPYLIRPRRKLHVYDSYALYNDYIGSLSIKDGLKSESDDETSSLEKDVSPGSLSDEEYVIVDNVEVSPNSETERAGAVQMMELSEDAIEESESGGSDSDAWVVV
ncbi:Uncharacterized protein Rs2_38083 [Raphanus sativus]|uniref:Uncharacterized protein LOC108823115 isoform X2 n=1 Tax=Raphanus sativus TaxID=3726 RepID=A0A9W3CB31_RAPSA|nr:uncharacterized protein LOC108823115 isoform X2 [Raphanus sativus]KAJ4881028.1 Uncharacterized protein Rs2_38083 [Raphanus sativus]